MTTILDKLCMVANIDTRKLIELKKAEIKIKEEKIQALSLSELIDSLEQKINYQACRLDALTMKKN
jgi:TPP-dependent 2-oxoacid decarboxylase